MEPTRDPEGIEIEVLCKTGSLHGRSVLEIGCGNGRLMWRYADFASSVVGIDPEIEKLAEIRETRASGLMGPSGLIRGSGLETPLLLTQTQAEDLPFPDELFESAIFGWSL